MPDPSQFNTGRSYPGRWTSPSATRRFNEGSAHETEPRANASRPSREPPVASCLTTTWLPATADA
jgi:hypothetical protein